MLQAVVSFGGKDQGTGLGERHVYLRHPAIPGALVGLAVVLTIVIAEHYSALYWRNVVDDAATSLQYAKNFALGRGIVFNPGERVEGYTNFLWVVIEAPLYALSRVTGLEFVSVVVHANILIAGLVVLRSMLLGTNRFPATFIRYWFGNVTFSRFT